MLSPGPHYTQGEEEIVEETEEEEEEEEEDGLEYATDTPSGGSYMTLPSTGGRLSPLPALSCSPTPGDSDPENNAALRTEELEARIEAFLALGAGGQLPSGSMLSTWRVLKQFAQLLPSGLGVGIF